jgi:hypothetical protein
MVRQGLADELHIRNPVQAITVTAQPWAQPVGNRFRGAAPCGGR